MAGNVIEWVEDVFHFDYEEAPDNGSAWLDGGDGRRVLRGSGFNLSAPFMRAACRGAYPEGDWRWYTGVRCVRDIPQN